MLQVLGHAIGITGFVFVMMMAIEYFNVLSTGLLQKNLSSSRWSQYLVAAFLGATPGCLGAFMVVGLYTHQMLSLGAVVTAMVATSGDEAFVMFAMIPGRALLLTGLLLVIGLLAGMITDLFKPTNKGSCPNLQIHSPEHCRCLHHGQILDQWQAPAIARVLLLVVLATFTLLVVFGRVGPRTWNWVRLTFLSLALFSIFVVATVPDHFLKDHLWQHLAKQHLPRIFFWTFGALLAMHLLTNSLHLGGVIQDNPWLVLLIAGLVGLIPESGPHLIFLTLYVQGAIPLSILLANSIVQDGHGMLPLLAQSRKNFLQVKLINLVAGYVVGAGGLWLGSR